DMTCPVCHGTRHTMPDQQKVSDQVRKDNSLSPLTVSDLAARAAVSPATLHRRFQAQLGTTPLTWLTGERLALACRLIERGESRFEMVARCSGLGTAANLRTLMRRETGITPSAYRRRFGPEVN
ncbi:helix-turn-helix domain-containing protein, partial [Streptomyces atratus]|uniref:helix-turn-helix domain-containing protein n=1 Tax=Streptomyces atratus TaxID=1893 RepID=UPI00368A7C96